MPHREMPSTLPAQPHLASDWAYSFAADASPSVDIQLWPLTWRCALVRRTAAPRTLKFDPPQIAGHLLHSSR